MTDFASDVRTFLARHPRPVGGTYLFCLFMCTIYFPYDFIVKWIVQGVEPAQEVWFGYMLVGWPAKLTEPLHGALYAAMAIGFHKELRFAWTLAALYTVQVAIGSAVWVWLYADYGPLGYALTPVVIAAFLGLALRIWQARPTA